jgi:NTE family protein
MELTIWSFRLIGRLDHFVRKGRFMLNVLPAASRPSPAPVRPPFERIALALQGGGALGAYQGGVYEALAEAGLHPDWVAGISIGAINAAIIAGNPPEARVARLRAFWELLSARQAPWLAPSPAALAPSALAPSAPDAPPFLKGDLARAWVNQWSAASAVWSGIPGFFSPRSLSPWLVPDGAPEATSYYDTRPLERTLERLIDFDRINDGPTRLSIGAVNVRTGDFVYFDRTTHRIGARHVMASGALPPGLPAVEIDGQHYWDGGLVSNTPLGWMVDAGPPRDTLVFQVDLWSARGPFPRNMAQVATRQKEIQYSSRTRAESNRFKKLQRFKNQVAELLAKLPPELAASAEAARLRPLCERKVGNLIHLIYRAKDYEGDSKDYEFSRRSIEERWRVGYHDTVRTLRHPEVLERPTSPDGVFIFDVDQHGRE